MHLHTDCQRIVALLKFEAVSFTAYADQEKCG